MDSLMAGMSGMGMDMSSDGLFYRYNSGLARAFWYIIASVLGVLVILRVINSWHTWSR
jgi:hypothetical protein